MDGGRARAAIDFRMNRFFLRLEIRTNSTRFKSDKIGMPIAVRWHSADGAVCGVAPRDASVFALVSIGFGWHAQLSQPRVASLMLAPLTSLPHALAWKPTSASSKPATPSSCEASSHVVPRGSENPRHLT